LSVLAVAAFILSAKPMAGPDNNLWFTKYGPKKIGRVSTSGAVSEYPSRPQGGQPPGSAAGPNATIWFTESIGNKIGTCALRG
jgi:virginiamycin B lyase